MQMLLEHSWPGNVRELDHAVERRAHVAGADGQADRSRPAQRDSSGGGRLEDMSLEDVEVFLIKKAMTRYDGTAVEGRGAGLSRSALLSPTAALRVVGRRSRSGDRRSEKSSTEDRLRRIFSFMPLTVSAS